MAATMPSSNAPAGNPLRLEVCPDCGYNLDGLPDGSVCPECGRAYDASLIVLYGWGRGDHADFANCTPETLMGYLLMGGITTICLTLLMSDAPLLVLFFLAFCGIMSLNLLRRFGVSYPGLVQMRLRDAGCEQRDDLRGQSMWKDIGPTINVILWVGFGLAILFFSRTNQTLSAPLASFAVISIATVGRWWRRRQSTRLAGDAAAHDFAPWAKIEHVLIMPAGTDRYHVRLRCPTAWLWARTPVDAELHCTDRQAEELRRRIEAWRRT
jgi:hypothetical protein